MPAGDGEVEGKDGARKWRVIMPRGGGDIREKQAGGGGGGGYGL